MASRRVFHFVLVLFLTAVTASAAERVVPVQKVKPGDLQGLVLDGRGRGFSNLELTLVNAEGETVRQAVTDKNGRYLVNDVPEGNYMLKIGGRDTFRVEVTAMAQATTLQTRIPAAARDPETGALKPEGLTLLDWSLIAIGGVAIAVGVPAVVHHNRDDDDPDPISP